jgi:hypothetical protein
MFLQADGHIKKIWAFYLPLAIALGLALINSILPKELVDIFYVENGILEILQPTICFTAVYVGINTLVKVKLSKWLRAWIAVAVLGALYVGLEEISYGQQILKWETGAYWAEVNDQNETNFHNTSSWLDQKPRLLLLIGIVIGGIITPLLARYRPLILPVRFEKIYPSIDLITVAGLVLFTQLSKVIYKLTEFLIYDRASELNEFYMFYFVLLYLCQLRYKLIKGQS